MSREEFEFICAARLRTMQRLAVMILGGILGTVCSGSFFFVLLLGHRVILPALLMVAGLSLCMLVIIYWRYGRNRVPLQPYCIQVPFETLDELVLRCNAAEIEPNAFAALVGFQKMDVRVVILRQQTYNQADLKRLRKRVNRIINCQRNISSEYSTWELAHKLRLNIVVLDHSDKKLEQWVGRNTEMLLERAEGVVNIGVLLDQKVILVPAMMGCPTFHVLKKYKTGVAFVQQKLLA